MLVSSFDWERERKSGHTLKRSESLRRSREVRDRLSSLIGDKWRQPGFWFGDEFCVLDSCFCVSSSSIYTLETANANAELIAYVLGGHARSQPIEVPFHVIHTLFKAINASIEVSLHRIHTLI
jgi:hypothetical protein